MESLGHHLETHPVGPDGLVFTIPKGRALDLNQVYGSVGRVRWFRQAARSIGLADEMSLHDLRHFYAC